MPAPKLTPLNETAFSMANPDIEKGKEKEKEKEKEKRKKKRKKGIQNLLRAAVERK